MTTSKFGRRMPLGSGIPNTKLDSLFEQNIGIAKRMMEECFQLGMKLGYQLARRSGGREPALQPKQEAKPPRAISVHSGELNVPLRSGVRERHK